MRRAAWWGMALACVAVPAWADDPVPAPVADRPAAELFKDVPAPWREYLLQARQAERLEDPLQRCLAYPDLPGNKWPAGHARAHCEVHILSTLPEGKFNRLLDEGRYAEVDQQLDALLARHLARTGFSEEIDYAFDAFASAKPEIDARTRAWLAASPESAYAHLARGVHLLNAGLSARGDKFIAETPRSQLQRMGEFFAQAVPELEQAASLQPKLMPAHAWLVVAAAYDSESTSKDAAVAAARKVDPACDVMFMRRMNASRPRWGGSFDEMLSLAGEISPFVPQRPQLAMYLGYPYAERGRLMLLNKQLDRETGEMLDIAIRMGSNEAALQDAANVALDAEDGSRDEWKALAYLMQESRFKDPGEWANRTVAQILMRMEPALSLRFASRAVEADPESAGARFYLASGYYSAKRFDEAEKQYLIAAEDPQWARDSLDNLVRMWMLDAGLEPKAGAIKARPFLDRLQKAYPDYGKGWLHRVFSDGFINGAPSNDVVNAFLRYADRTDPQQAQIAEMLEKLKAAGRPDAMKRSGGMSGQEP